MHFSSEKVSSLSGETEIRFTAYEEDNMTNPFRVTASKAGIKFEGRSRMVETLEELEAFAKVVSKAWEAHRKFIPNFMEGIEHAPK